MPVSKLESKMWSQIVAAKVDEGCVPELQFHTTRKWRFDFCWPRHKIALEVQGGVWSKGRHARPRGILNDYEKFSEAAIMGWRLILVTGLEINNGAAIDRVQRALEY